MLTDSLRAASTQATSSTLVLARLEVSDGRCRPLLDELHERAGDSERGSAAVATIAGRASQALNPVDVMRLAAILHEIAHHADDAGEWWCRATACKAQMRGAGGAVRDAMRALDSAILALDAAPHARDHALQELEACVAEGRRLARRARADAVTGDDAEQALSRMAALSAIDRALRACAVGGRTLGRLAAGRG